MDSEIAGQIHDYVESAAPPIPLESITRRSAAPGQIGRPSIRRQVSLRRAIALAAATAAAVAAVTIGIKETGSSSAHRSPGATVLTAATVHHVEAASQAAMAPAGHVLVTFSVGLINHPASSGSIDFTFSGHNFNAVDRLPTPPGDRKGQPLTSRRVDGQLYIFGLPGRPQQWYHLQGKTAAGRIVPDPRKLLTALQPDARFEDIGSQIIDGVQTKILSATQLKKLPASVLSSLTFVSVMGPEPLTAFDVWVDRHGVVRQMKIIHQAQSPQGRLIEKQTIRFLDIGKPEKITVPGRYVNQAPGR